VTPASELAFWLGAIADSLKRQNQTFSGGTLRQAAHLLVQKEAQLGRHRPPLGDECRRCRRRIEQDGRGRPRIYCEACSPKKKPENATLLSEVNE
jgi:hypothetical protein